MEAGKQECGGRKSGMYKWKSRNVEEGKPKYGSGKIGNVEAGIHDRGSRKAATQKYGNDYRNGFCATKGRDK